MGDNEVHELSCEELRETITRLENEVAVCRQAENVYRLMLESSTDSLFMVDGDCRYIFINNRHLLTRLNLPMEEVLGKSYGEFHTPENTCEFTRIVKEVLSKGISRQQEHKSHRDGRHFLRTFSPVKDTEASERIDAVLVVSKDISELKLVEASLQKSKALHRELMNGIKSMVFLKDDQFRYLLVNTAFLQWLNKKEEEVLGKTDFELLPQRVAEKLREAEKEALRTGFFSLVSDRLIEGRVHELKVFSMGLADKRTGIGGLVTDITEKVQADAEKEKLEVQFLQAQKMEAIGTLAGGIAHDFNNLLMGIQGYISLMLFDMDANHPHYDRLKNIEQQVQNGADLTKQLLGFARGGKYEIKSINLNKVIGKSAAIFGRAKKEIRIYENYEPNLWTVEADRGQVEQVLLNLYVNAWQAMPDGGSVYLETENCQLDHTDGQHYFVQPGRYVKITVSDTGVGMEENVRARIFEPFFTTKEMGRGTGLGLATVYGIIKAHGGIINVNSEIGQGSVFSIYLPASNNKAEKEKEDVPELSKGTETILVIDDEKMVIDVTREILEVLGYDVIMATSGDEAVDIYRRNKSEISLVVLDMIMPGMSGGETFDALKQINPLVKVILSSGYSLNNKVSEILQRGCLAFLQKPFSIQELSRVIRKTLAEKVT